MNAERLKILATILDEAAAGTWRPTVGQGAEDSPNIKFHLAGWVDPVEMEDGSCGFAACAIGHAMLDQRLAITGTDIEEGIDPSPFNPECGAEGWDAVTTFFDIEERTAVWLFEPFTADYRRDDDPAEVAERIRQVVAGKH